MSALPAHADSSSELAEPDFRLIAAIIHREAGIVVREHKHAMVRGRLVRRARELGLPSVESYVARLRGPALADELPGLLNALTTNHTSFYREAHHFEHLEEVAVPALATGDGARRLRIWCAAASSGEEPYTIAGTLLAAMPGGRHPDCLILATDIDSNVLDDAARGAYTAAAIARLTERQRQRLRLSTTPDGSVAVGPELMAMVRFRQLNILHDWPFQGPFHAIFCRNMLIYFDQETKTGVITRMRDMLTPGGFLYLGHSEALPAAVPGLQPVGRTVYRRS
jgi:chemotaxis protein methyltransferase CheR